MTATTKPPSRIEVQSYGDKWVVFKPFDDGECGWLGADWRFENLIENATYYDNRVDAELHYLASQTVDAFRYVVNNNGKVPSGMRLEFLNMSGLWQLSAKADLPYSFTSAANYRLVPLAVPEVKAPRFKVGDRVRCVDATTMVGIRNGNIYTVSDVLLNMPDCEYPSYPNASGNCVTLSDTHCDNGRSQYDFARFELVPPIPRYTVSSDPCGVRDSERPGKYLPSEPESAKSIARKLNDGIRDWCDYASADFTLTRTVPLEASDVPPGSVFRRNASDIGYLVPIEVTQSKAHFTGKVHAWSANFESMISDHWQILRPGQDWQPCSKQVPAT